MPARAPTPCRKPGCGALCRDGKGYCEEHRNEGWRRHQRGRTPHEQGYGAAWVKLRAVVVRRDKGLCQQCMSDGRITPGADVDHIIPKSQGGTDDLDNLQLLCRKHHRTKTAAESQGGRSGSLAALC